MSAPPNTCLLTVKRNDYGEPRILSSLEKKSAERLRIELELLVKSAGINTLVFVTLTFLEPLPNHQTRNKIYLRFLKLALAQLFRCGVTIFDRSASGRPHFHVVAVGDESKDFRTGFDFQEWRLIRDAENKLSINAKNATTTRQRLEQRKRRCSASASPDLKCLTKALEEAAQQAGFGRIHVMPIENEVAYAKYLAQCVTEVFKQNNAEDRRIRRYRFWGDFPRKVTPKFSRLTKGAKRWRGKLAFCAHVLRFAEYSDFEKCFGPRWFIYLKGIIRLVPGPLAEASLVTGNLPLSLITRYSRRIQKIETELLGRLQDYGNRSYWN